MKSFIKKSSAIILSALSIISFGACSKQEAPTPDENYLKNISVQEFWENTAETSVAEYHVYDLVNDFLADTEIRDGNAVAKDGKFKKVLFLGFDGMRADAVQNVMDNEYSSPYSGINELSKTGGIYLAYCGGEKGTDTEQTTSTSASWTSQFTGVWGSKHGIKTNEDTKNMEYKTFMLQYAEKGLQTSIAFDWDPYFDVNLKEEVKYVMEHPEIKMTFCDINREKIAKRDRKQKESLEFYNFTAPEKITEYDPYDLGMSDYVAGRINGGDDIVCGIFHNIDTNGHTYEFSNNSSHYISSVRNNDYYAYQLIELVKQREKEYNESWLIIFANDHGGIGTGHGGQSLEERTTWIATNIKFDEKYYSSNYNGFNEKG